MINTNWSAQIDSDFDPERVVLASPKRLRLIMIAGLAIANILVLLIAAGSLYQSKKLHEDTADTKLHSIE